MKRKRWIPVAAIVLVAVVGAYFGRGYLRDAYDAWRAPKLPTAARYQPKPADAGVMPSVPDAPSPFEPGYSTSEHFVLETSPTVKGTPQEQKDPLAFEGTLPAEANLDVPFTTQAPFSNWDMPYQEACEEASTIMVDSFYKGQSGKIDQTSADTAILKFVNYEKATLGFYADTTAEELAKVIRDYMGYKTVIVKPLESIDDIKQAVALGYPVIVPMAGKLLGNPNFKNGGPLYHMLVIRGYTPDLIITNDPGTRKGFGYTYSYDTIMKAAHDWNGGKVTEGKRVIIVVIPNPS
jgi:hypothetical protein